jgi:S1-C subfamily serine protease
MIAIRAGPVPRAALAHGALVASIVPNGPAARAGLKSSDLIVAIDGQTVDDPNAFDYCFVTCPLGGAAHIVAGYSDCGVCVKRSLA